MACMPFKNASTTVVFVGFAEIPSTRPASRIHLSAAYFFQVGITIPFDLLAHPARRRNAHHGVVKISRSMVWVNALSWVSVSSCTTLIISAGVPYRFAPERV